MRKIIWWLRLNYGPYLIGVLVKRNIIGNTAAVNRARESGINKAFK